MCGPRHLTRGHRHRLEWQYPDRLTKSRLTPLNLCKSVGLEAAGRRETALVLLSTVLGKCQFVMQEMSGKNVAFTLTLDPNHQL